MSQWVSAEHDRRIAAMIQAGTVEEVDYATARCRVRVGDWVSAWVPWQTLSGGAVRHWNPPSVGEQCMMMSPSGEPANGFVLPGFYTQQHQGAPANTGNVIAWAMPDGAAIEYNHATGTLNAVGVKVAIIRASQAIKIYCDDVQIEGNVTITGDLDVTGIIHSDTDVLADSISGKAHDHTEPVGPPV